MLTQDEQAAIALKDADPNQLARVQVRTDYAAYDLKELVESKISDPSMADEATVNALFDTYAPVAWYQAGQWVSTLDQSAVPLARVTPTYECSGKYGCTGTTTCDFDGTRNLLIASSPIVARVSVRLARACSVLMPSS